MIDYAFSPARITVIAGTKVTFTPHPYMIGQVIVTGADVSSGPAMVVESTTSQPSALPASAPLDHGMQR